MLTVDDGEKTMADRIYRDNKFFILPDARNQGLHARIMARHETVNRRIKQFRALGQKFRHDRQKHPMVFHAVINLTQLMLENGEPLFTV